MRSVVSLFTGGGGLDLGLEAAGFDTLFASDIDEHSCISLETNKIRARKLEKPFLQHAKILKEDIRGLDGNKILDSIGLKCGDVDLLAGGPPCQAFSIFGKRRGREDPRGKLIYEYLKILCDLQPKAFVFENVFGLLTAEGGKVFQDLQTLLSKPMDGLKYTLSVHRCNAADYGVPQFRDRVFIIGSRADKKIRNISKICGNPNKSTDNLLDWRTVGDGFNGVPKIGTRGWHNHTGRKHSQRIINRYSSMSYGERDHHTRINRLDPNRPSYTIIVGSDAGGGKGHIHPYEGREVTPRESARMQCFPDWWWFSGTSRHPIRQIGNAVPTLLGFAVGYEILRSIFQEEPRSFYEGVCLLDQKHLFSDSDLEYLQACGQNDQHNPDLLAR